MHPVVLCGIVAVDGFGQAAGHVDEVIQGHGGDAALGNGDVGPQQPAVCLRVVALDLGVGAEEGQPPRVFK